MFISFAEETCSLPLSRPGLSLVKFEDNLWSLTLRPYLRHTSRKSAQSSTSPLLYLENRVQFESHIEFHSIQIFFEYYIFLYVSDISLIPSPWSQEILLLCLQFHIETLQHLPLPYFSIPFAPNFASWCYFPLVPFPSLQVLRDPRERSLISRVRLFTLSPCGSFWWSFLRTLELSCGTSGARTLNCHQPHHTFPPPLCVSSLLSCCFAFRPKPLHTFLTFHHTDSSSTTQSLFTHTHFQS